MDQQRLLLDDPAISRRVFYPRESRLPEPSLWVDVGAVRLGCYLVQSNPQAGWVIYFHGNGELASESMAYGSGLFTSAGVNVCFAEYRGYGASSGEPVLAAMLEDGEAIFQRLGIPAKRVVAFGRSLGSLYAIELAHRVPNLGGLIIESGIADAFEQWKFTQQAMEMGCSVEAIQAAMRTYFDHQAKLAGYTGPVLVLHTEQDRLVPVSHAERLHQWAGGTAKKLVVFDMGGHNNIFAINQREYVAQVHQFLRGCGITPPETATS